MQRCLSHVANLQIAIVQKLSLFLSFNLLNACFFLPSSRSHCPVCGSILLSYI